MMVVCRMRLELDPDPQASYASVPLPVAQWADAVFDWLEQDPVNPHATRHRYTTGTYEVRATIEGLEWRLLWEREGDRAVVVYLGEQKLL